MHFQNRFFVEKLPHLSGKPVQNSLKTIRKAQIGLGNASMKHLRRSYEEYTYTKHLFQFNG